MTQQQYGQPPYQQPAPQYAPPAPQGYQTYPPQPDPYTQQGYAPALGLVQPNPYSQPAPQYQQYGQPQGYGQVPPPPPPVQAPQGPPLPQGTLDDFYNQRSVGSGKGLSWNGKPDGYRYIGVVTKTPSNSDVFVDTQPAAQGGAPKQNRDGSFKYVLQVQLRIAWLDQFQQFSYADQDARLFLRGGLRDETTRAMHEVGAEGVPQEGALIDVTLTGRKPGNNIATNVFAVVYRPAGTWENDPQYAPFVPQLLGGQAPQPNPQQNQVLQNQAPYQQQATAHYAAPAQAAPNPQQYAQQYAQQGPPAYVGQAPQAYDPNQQNGQPQTAPQYGQAPAGAAGAGDQAANPQAPGQTALPAGAYPNQPNPNGQQQQLPYGAPQGGPAPAPGTGQMPAGAPAPQPGTSGSGLDPARQQLLARITNQQQPQQG